MSKKKTHTNPLSKREIEHLCNNPYIASVTANTVRFTEQFRQMAFDGKLRGASVSETMRRCGIGLRILGASKVEGFRYTLNKKAKQGSGFADQRRENYRRPDRTGNEITEQRLWQLENELAYTRQEVELKKNCRQHREESDSADFALVKKACEFRGYRKCALSIYMRLLHLDLPVVI